MQNQTYHRQEEIATGHGSGNMSVEIELAEHGLKLGINPDLGNSAYHAGPGVSCSDLKVLLDKTPAHLAYRKSNPSIPTDAMNIGSLFHTVVLEPEKMYSRFVVLPEGVDFRSKEGKLIRDAAVFEGKILVRHSDLEAVQRMSNSVKGHPAANALLNRQVGTSYEQPVYYVDPDTGLLGKFKPDVLVVNDRLKLIVDLKTCEDASAQGFARTIANFLYDLQAAKYLHGANCAFGDGFQRFVFIAVEKSAPHAVACYVATHEMVQAGREQLTHAMSIYQGCYETGNWPGYSDKIEEIELPPWRI